MTKSKKAVKKTSKKKAKARRRAESTGTPKPDREGHYSFADAAHVILEEQAKQMHYGKITDEAMRRNMIVEPVPVRWTDSGAE